MNVLGPTSTSSTGAVALGGLASGIDTTSLVQGLVQADSGQLQQLRQQQLRTQDASSKISDIGTQLAALKSAASALSTFAQVGSFTATSSSTAVAVSSSGGAQPGNYQVQVSQLAFAQTTFSKTLGTSETAGLGLSGTFTIAEGTGKAATITVGATDSVDSIVANINAQATTSGARIAASVFFDGTNYRVQIQGLDTGKANTLTFADTTGTVAGTGLDLNSASTNPASAAGYTPHPGTIDTGGAGDAHVTIGGIPVTRPTNQVTGAIQGVTLALAQTTTTPVTVSVASDPSSLATKLTAVVSAYNKVVQSIHAAAGYASVKPSNLRLAGDPTLRDVTSQISTTLLAANKNGQYASLNQIGIAFQRDGTLTLDQGALTTAFNSDPQSVEALLGRPANATTGGAMANLADAISTLTDTVTGEVTVHGKAVSDEAKAFDDRIAREQARLDRYQSQLQKQFAQMEVTYASNQALLGQLSQIGIQRSTR